MLPSHQCDYAHNYLSSWLWISNLRMRRLAGLSIISSVKLPLIIWPSTQIDILISFQIRPFRCLTLFCLQKLTHKYFLRLCMLHRAACRKRQGFALVKWSTYQPLMQNVREGRRMVSSALVYARVVMPLSRYFSTTMYILARNNNTRHRTNKLRSRSMLVWGLQPKC